MAESRVVRFDISIPQTDSTASREIATNSRPISDKEAVSLELLGVHWWIDNPMPAVQQWDIASWLLIGVYETEEAGTRERPIVGFSPTVSPGTENATATAFMPVVYGWHGQWSPPSKAMEVCPKRILGAHADINGMDGPLTIFLHAYFRMVKMDIQDFIQLRAREW